ncbi:hypothetical protein CYMTET_18303, partial [Cymbomonas tetramitiformis]
TASLLLMGYFAIGVVHYMMVEGWSFDEAVYFIIVTLTTIGYGDYVPTTTESKLFTGFYAQLGMLAIGAALVILFTSMFEHQQKLLMNVIRPSENPQDVHTAQLRQNFILVTRIIGLLLFYTGVVMIGTLFYHRHEGLSMVDSFYMMNITLSSVGYGDVSPSTWQGRVFFICTVPPGYVAGVQFVTDVLKTIINRRKEKLLAEMLGMKKTLRAAEVTSWDVDGDSQVNEMEFTLGMLKKMGKVSQYDLDKIKQRFKEVDSDKNGALEIGELDYVCRKDGKRTLSVETVEGSGRNKSVMFTSVQNTPLHTQSASDTSASGNVFIMKTVNSLGEK